jgi:hypothetical protein
MFRLFRIIDSSDPECWACTGLIPFVARDLGVRYMMAPPGISVSSVDVVFPVHLLCQSASSCDEAENLQNRHICLHTFTSIQNKLFIIIAIQRYAADSKADATYLLSISK